MTATYYVTLTDHGSERVAQAHGQAEIILVNLVLGDANGLPYDPISKKTRTSLVNQRASVPVQSVVVNGSIARVTATIDSSIGGFNIHELGLTDSTGKLVYIGNYHGGFKPVLTDGASGEIELFIEIKADAGSQILIEVDPTVISANKKWVKSQIKAIADTVWHVGSWHGSDNLSYNPRTALEPVFGYLTNWELRPYAPYGVQNSSDALQQVSNIAGGDTKKANSTRIWKRLPDDFNATITANKTIAFERDVITFIVVADNVPDDTVVAYELVGDNITIDDFRETQISKTLKGQIVFYNNQAQITLTVNSFELVDDVIYGNQNFDDVGRLKLKLIGVSAAESNIVTLPVIYAGLSQTECIANGGAASTYFVVATRGIPIGTECTVTCDLGGIEENFTIDATGRHIVAIPLIHYFPNDTNQLDFSCSLAVMGKLFRDSGILHRLDSGQTQMRFFEPTMALIGQAMVNGYVVVNASDGTFANRGLIWAAKSGNDLTSRTVFSSLEHVMASKDGTDLKAIIKQSDTELSSGQFAVLQVGTEDINGSGLIKPFKAFAKLLVYKP